MAPTQKRSLATPESPILNVGDLVRWYVKGWRFGRLLKVSVKYVWVQHLSKSKRLLLKDIEPYESTNK